MSAVCGSYLSSQRSDAGSRADSQAGGSRFGEMAQGIIAKLNHMSSNQEHLPSRSSLVDAPTANTPLQQEVIDRLEKAERDPVANPLELLEAVKAAQANILMEPKARDAHQDLMRNRVQQVEQEVTSLQELVEQMQAKLSKLCESTLELLPARLENIENMQKVFDQKLVTHVESKREILPQIPDLGIDRQPGNLEAILALKTAQANLEKEFVEFKASRPNHEALHSESMDILQSFDAKLCLEIQERESLAQVVDRISLGASNGGAFRKLDSDSGREGVADLVAPFVKSLEGQLQSMAELNQTLHDMTVEGRTALHKRCDDIHERLGSLHAEVVEERLARVKESDGMREQMRKVAAQRSSVMGTTVESVDLSSPVVSARDVLGVPETSFADGELASLRQRVEQTYAEWTSCRDSMRERIDEIEKLTSRQQFTVSQQVHHEKTLREAQIEQIRTHIGHVEIKINGDRQIQASYDARMHERVDRLGQALDSNNETLMRIVEDSKDWREEHGKEMKGLHDRVSVLSVLHEAQKEAIRMEIAEESDRKKKATEDRARLALAKWQHSLSEPFSGLSDISDGNVEPELDSADLQSPLLHAQLDTLREEDEDAEQIDHMSTSYKLSTAGL